MKKLTAVCLSAVLVFALASCGGPSPTETVNTFLTAMQNGEAAGEIYEDASFQISQDLIDEELEGEEYTDAEKEIMTDFITKVKDFEFTLSNEVIKDDKATVDVELKTYNFGSELESMFTDYLTKAMEMIFDDPTDEELEKLLNDLAISHLGKLEKNYTTTVTIKLTEKDGTWVIDEFKDDDEFINGLLGNMLKVMDSLDEDSDF